MHNIAMRTARKSGRSCVMTKPLAHGWEHACSLVRNKRLAARSWSAPDQTKALGGSGSAPGVMPDPLITETMHCKRPSIGATISTDGGSHTAQQPVPPEWKQPPAQL